MDLIFTESAASGKKDRIPSHRMGTIMRFLMKVSLFYIAVTTISIQLIASNGKGQNLEDIKVTVGLQNEKLETLFKTIEEQTGLLFTFFPEQIDRYAPLNLPKATRSVKATLDMVLRATSLSYRHVNNNIVILEDPFIASVSNKFVSVPLSNPVPLYSYSIPTVTEVRQQPQRVTVSGTVTDAQTGNPMPGVNVLVKGTTNGTSTDANGKFSLDVQDGDVLVFTFIGFKTVETVIGARTVINVTMEEDVEALQEVVINAGYWEVTEREKTGNISRVTSEEIEKQPVHNVLQALQGRMPGVEITQFTGAPGSSFTIRIRGQNSLRPEGNEPLMMIDGVPFPTVFNQLYGDEGNAVLGGSGTNPLVSINPLDIESIEVLKDADATAIYGSRGANGVILITTKKAKKGKPKLNLNVQRGFSEVSNKMDLLNTEQYLEMRMEAFENDGQTPGLTDFDVNGTWDQNRYTDWQDVLWGNRSTTTSLSTSISAGSDNMKFLLSGNYYNETSFYTGNFHFNRISGHLSLDWSDNSNKFDIGISTTYNLSQNKLPTKGLSHDALTLPPNAPAIYDEDGNLNWALNSNGAPTWENPFSFLLETYKLKANSFVTNARINYSILPSLQIRANIGYSDTWNNSTTLKPARAQAPSSGVTNRTRFYQSQTKSYNIEPQIQYKQNILGGKLNVLLGLTIQENGTMGQGITGIGYATEALMENLGAAQELGNGFGTSLEYRYTAIFSRINYTYNSKYIINLTGRRDGSSRFGPGKQFANFGAIGLAWIFSDENFMRNVRFLNFGKLRTSYGTTGSDQIADYGYLTTYRTALAYQVAALSPSRLPNPDYAWESNKKFEAAIETGFINNRIKFSLSWFKNTSSNQLVGYPLPNFVGFPEVQANLEATIQNTGWEFTFNTENIKKENFLWTTRINLSLPKNKLVEYPNLELSSYASQYIVGEPLQVIRGYTFLGIDPDTGLEMILDADENGSINLDDRKLLNASQLWSGGIDNVFQFRGLSLNIFLQTVIQEGMANPYSGFPLPGTMGNQPILVMKRWRNPGDNSEFRKFTQVNGTSYNQWAQSTANFNRDRSFVRLRNISLSYALPVKWLKHLQQASIHIQAQNVITLTKYKGLTPEGATIPPLRTITGGLNITF